LDETNVIDIPDDLEEFDSDDIWNQIIEMNEKQGYVDYSELVF
tara:strand:- start:103 stop:231 length:129 start_codon:yes stop_codon:yes gene_type:complete